MGNMNLTFFTKKCMPSTKRVETDHNPGVSELHAKMCSFAEKDQNGYSLEWMKKQLEQHYQNSVFFTDELGRLNVVYFTNMASTILSERW